VGSEPLEEEPPPVEPVEASLSEHVAVEPPLLPPQLHDHGPLPLTADVVPVVQRFAVGAVLTDAPFALPHAPLTGCAEATFVAEQVAVVPPLLPSQLHDHGPLPLTAVAVPVVQRLAVGALLSLPPFEEPQAPFTAVGVVEVVAVSVAYNDQVVGVQLAGEVLNLLGRAAKA
jgi:hypothetical protein